MPVNTLHNLRVTVPVPGTAVAASGVRPTQSCLVVALDANVGLVAVGGEEGASANPASPVGAQLAAGDSLPLGAVDLSDIFIDAATANEGVVLLFEE